MASPPKKSLLRSLGEFFGHISRGVKTPITPPRQILRTDIQEKTVDTPRGPVTLRRTTIDEIETRKPGS